jgi:hypothetical protein
VTPSDDGGRPSAIADRARSIAAGLSGFVAVLGLVGGMLGFWTLRTATDSDRFETRVQSLLEDEAISDALAGRVVTEVADGIGIREAVEVAMPEVLRPAIDLLAAGARSRLEDRVAELIRSPEVSGNVATAAGRAHDLAVDVIEGNDVVDGVDISDGAVRVNLLPLSARALTAMQEIGLLRDVAVPELERSGDPDEQRAQLEAALGRDLPEGFGTPVVFRSESLDRAGDTVGLVRDLLVMAKRALWFLLIGGLALAVVSIRLSSQRWRSASFIVAGMFAFTLILRLALARATERLPGVVEQPGARATVREITADLERNLNQTMLVYSALGLVTLGLAAAVQFGVFGRLRPRGGN